MRYHKLSWLALVLVVILVFPGCAGKKEAKKDPFFDTWKAMAENSKGHSPASTTRMDELQGQMNELEAIEKEEKAEPERPLPTQNVDLNMYKISVVTAIRALARAANLNIIISANVKGEISIRLKDTPWNHAFCGLLRTHGLTYIWEGDIIRVMTAEDMEHDLKIDAIKEKRKAHELGIKRVEPLMTQIINIKFADAKGLKENLQELLIKDKDGKPRGTVKVDEHTNSLIIQAIRDDIVKIFPLIVKLDRPTSQILIEAQIIEATRDTAQQLGIQWGGLYHAGDYWITPGANTTGNLGLPLTTPVDPATGSAVNFPADLSGGAGLTLGYLAQNVGKGLLNVQLSALEEEGKLNILSSPSITTIDNQVATIESGEEVPFQTVDKDGNIKIEWKKATLSLEVTPHVIEDRILKMKIITSKDELDFTRTVAGNPTIITKKAETNLILFDGQTTVIGGLTKETTSESDSGVPGLKDIPLLGYLFKAAGKSNKMEDVLIFITPHILKEKESAHYPKGSGDVGVPAQRKETESNEEEKPSS